MGKVKLHFCVVCHKIKKIGKWCAIDDKTEKELRTKFGKWDAIMVVCDSCSDVEVSDEPDLPAV
jgi:hypothetical protein